MGLTTADWMSDLGEAIASRPLRELCLPGSHHAGMYTLTHPTLLAAEGLVRTQYEPIAGQLAAGARVLDLRPCLWTDHVWHCGRFSHDAVVGWQGATGERLDDVLAAIVAFARAHRRELIVLVFSGYRNCLTWQEFGTVEIAQLLRAVRLSLGDRLIGGIGGAVAGLTPDELREGGGNVLCLFDGIGDQADAGCGLFDAAAAGLAVAELDCGLDSAAAILRDRRQRLESGIAGDGLRLLSWTGTPAGGGSTYQLATAINGRLAATLASGGFSPGLVIADYVRPAVAEAVIRLNAGGLAIGRAGAAKSSRLAS